MTTLQLLIVFSCPKAIFENPLGLSVSKTWETRMEATFYEDPACSWCWAFQPVATAFAFEFRPQIKTRYVMGGLRDLPARDIDFVVRQWKMAKKVSGMPFEPGIWKQHALETTFLACRAVKAASIIGSGVELRLLRRLREAYFMEKAPIDDMDRVLSLGEDVGIERDILRENLLSGRADTLFARDRTEASQYGFGFPTLVLRSGKQEEPTILQGAVQYSEVVHSLHLMGVSTKDRRRFQDTPDDWHELFEIHRRLTLREIREVVPGEESKLLARMHSLGYRKAGAFYEIPLPKARKKPDPPVTVKVPAPDAVAASPSSGRTAGPLMAEDPGPSDSASDSPSGSPSGEEATG